MRGSKSSLLNSLPTPDEETKRGGDGRDAKSKKSPHKKQNQDSPSQLFSISSAREGTTSCFTGLIIPPESDALCTFQPFQRHWETGRSRGCGGARVCWHVLMRERYSNRFWSSRPGTGRGKALCCQWGGLNRYPALRFFISWQLVFFCSRGVLLRLLGLGMVRFTGRGKSWH